MGSVLCIPQVVLLISICFHLDTNLHNNVIVLYAVATTHTAAAGWCPYADSDIGTTIFHPVGTCKMGDADKDPSSVVDSKLKIYGISGLRVADASVMPNITSGNTAAPTMVIAEKCFRMITDEQQQSTLFHSQ